MQACGYLLKQVFILLPMYTVDSRYLKFAYLEKPLISKWKSGPCFNMEI